jgi:hypothetical protein
MEVKMSKKGEFILVLIFGIFFIGIFYATLVGSAMGFGITSSYYKGNPLIMAPGETKNIEFGKLQNMVSESGNITIRAELVSGANIATLLDPSTEYFVPSGSDNVSVNMKVSIPKQAINGTQYSITIKFRDITEIKSEEMVAFAKTTTKSIDVLVLAPEHFQVTNIWWLFFSFILIISFVIILYIILKNKTVFRGIKEEEILR